MIIPGEDSHGQQLSVRATWSYKNSLVEDPRAAVQTSTILSPIPLYFSSLFLTDLLVDVLSPTNKHWFSVS